jgi:hypothetical protein
MLKAFKVATESYLETSILDVEIVVPFPVNETYCNTIGAACSAVSLQQPASALGPVGILALKAQGLRNGNFWNDPSRNDDPQQLFLTIEYSKAALTAILIHEQCSILEVRREMHEPQFGLDYLHEGSINDLTKMEDSLKEVVSLPLYDGGTGQESRHISGLIVFGEPASDPQLENVLEKVFKSD